MGTRREITWHEPPPGSTLSVYDWHQWVNLARALVEPGEPAIVPETRGGLALEWTVDEGRPVRLQRIVVLDPEGSGFPVAVEQWWRERCEQRLFGIPQAAVPIVAVIFVLLLVASHNLVSGRFGLAVACAIGSLLAAPLLWRHERVWRELDVRGPIHDRELAQEALELAEAHADGWRARDATAIADAQRRAWARGTPVRVIERRGRRLSLARAQR